MAYINGNKPVEVEKAAGAVEAPEPKPAYNTQNQQVWGEGGSGRDGYREIGAAEGERLKNSSHGGKPLTEEEWAALPDASGFYVDRDKRVREEGTSGADEDLVFNDRDYAQLKANQAEWMNLATLKQEAAKSGDYEAVARYQAQQDWLHDANERIRLGYGYSGGADGTMYIPTGVLGYNPNEQAANNTGVGVYRHSGTADSGNGYTGTTGSDTSATTGNDMISGMKELLNAWQQAAVNQSNGQVDYAVAKAVADLERALADAQSQFKEQAESVDMNARQAMDNSALYAEMRGDRGGIGGEQYNSIQNTAAQNHLSVQQAQTKLATDTQRQIADLRAQGEFEKADAALAVTQEYLAKLVSLEQWAAEYNLSVEQFNAQLAQWEKEYQLSLQQLEISQSQWQAEFGLAQQQFQAGLDQWQQKFDSDNYWKQQEFDFNKLMQEISQEQWQQKFDSDNYWNQRELDYEKMTAEQKQVASMGEALLSAGIMPSDEQLSAMGMTKAQAQAYITAIQLENASGGITGEDFSNSLAKLYADAQASGSPEVYLANNYKKYGLTSSSGLLEGYNAWITKEHASTKDPNGDGIADASVAALGLGNIGFGVLEDMVEQGVLQMKTNELGLVVVSWAPGWNASKFKNHMLI